MQNDLVYSLIQETACHARVGPFLGLVFRYRDSLFCKTLHIANFLCTVAVTIWRIRSALCAIMIKPYVSVMNFKKS